MRHLGLVSVVGEEPVGQDEPALLVALDVVGPFVEPTLGLGGARDRHGGRNDGLVRGQRRRLDLSVGRGTGGGGDRGDRGGGGRAGDSGGLRGRPLGAAPQPITTSHPGPT